MICVAAVPVASLTASTATTRPAAQTPVIKKTATPPALSGMTARLVASSRDLRPGERVTVRLTGCPHGSTNDFGVFFHDHREVAIDRHDQSGLLHPTTRWSTATSGTAVIYLPPTTRLGRSLITGVCETVNAPAEQTVWVR